LNGLHRRPLHRLALRLRGALCHCVLLLALHLLLTDRLQPLQLLLLLLLLGLLGLALTLKEELLLLRRRLREGHSDPRIDSRRKGRDQCQASHP
jgi:hypothetical protein